MRDHDGRVEPGPHGFEHQRAIGIAHLQAVFIHQARGVDSGIRQTETAEVALDFVLQIRHRALLLRINFFDGAAGGQDMDALQTSSIIPSMLGTRSVAIFALFCTGVLAQTVPDAHFHHLHLNATDPKADIEFYTTKFDAEKASFNGLIDAIWAQKSWILAQKVANAPPSEVVSTIWHFGWGAEDM